MTQYSYSVLWDGYPSDAAAKAARDERYRQLRKDGIRARRWVLRNQTRPYAAFGQPDGHSCDVYVLDVYEVPLFNRAARRLARPGQARQSLTRSTDDENGYRDGRGR